MQNINRVELKLLLVFDAVFTERSATRAALRLGMTQPAVSNALNKLRDVLHDPLFLRSANGMRPTPRAVEFAVPVNHILSRLLSALEPVQFDPAKSSWNFRVGVAPSPGIVLLPALLKRLQTLAPNVTLQVRHPDGEQYPAMIDNDEVDLVIVNSPKSPTRFASKKLYLDNYTAVMRPDHPLSRGRMTLKRFADAPHVMISHLYRSRNLLDETLAGFDLRRHVHVVVTDQASGIGIINSTDLITGLFRRTLESMAEFRNGSVIHRPLPVPPVPAVMIWHEGLKNHPAHQWLRRQIIDVAGEIVR